MKSKLLIIAIASLTSFAMAADGDKKAAGGDRKGKRPQGDGQNHPPGKRAEMMLKYADKDGNGSLNLKEFAHTRIGKHIAEKHGADGVKKMFDRADKNKDGELNKGELASMGPQKGKPGNGKPGADKPGKGKGNS